MPQAKPKAAVKPQEASEAPEAKPTKSGDIVTVKNIGSKPANLSKGIIDPGETGDATIAEVSMLHRTIKRV